MPFLGVGPRKLALTPQQCLGWTYPQGEWERLGICPGWEAGAEMSSLFCVLFS